jgi:HSP20 family protein
MTLLNYHPAQVQKTPSVFFDKFFNEFIESAKQNKFLPDVDLVESEKSFELHLAVPGLQKEDFNIEITGDTLVVSGERKFVNETNEKTFHSIETKYGSFSRSFQLPEAVDANHISAEYVNGILTVEIPKDESKKIKSKILVK